MVDKEELLAHVKSWIHMDDEIARLRREMREKRLEKKTLTEALMEVMRANNIDCFDVGGGNKLLYTKHKTRKALSKKHLLECLGNFFQDNSEQAENLGKYIMDTREQKVRENIRRKTKK